MPLEGTGVSCRTPPLRVIPSVPENPSQPLDDLSPDVIRLLQHHGVLRTLFRAQATEELLDPDNLEPETLKQAMQDYRRRHGLATAEQLQAHRSSHGYTNADLQWQASLPERIRRTSQRLYQPKAELHYLTCKEQFDQVTYSQLSAPNQFLAQELFLRLNEQEANFGELAAELRQSGHQQGQGRFGPMVLANVPAPLAKPLRSCTPGTLLEPIQVRNNWLIVRLEQFQASQFDQAMEQRMCAELFQQEVDRRVDERISRSAAAGVSTNGHQQS